MTHHNNFSDNLKDKAFVLTGSPLQGNVGKPGNPSSSCVVVLTNTYLPATVVGQRHNNGERFLRFGKSSPMVCRTSE